MTRNLPTLAAPAPSLAQGDLTVASLLAFLALGLMAVFPSHALDLVAFTGIAGPLAAALAQLAALAPGRQGARRLRRLRGRLHQPGRPAQLRACPVLPGHGDLRRRRA